MKELFSICKENGLRLTPTLRRVLEVLQNTKVPMSLAELEAAVDKCDPATVYRTVKRLQQVGLIRCLSFVERGARYTLAANSENINYLICEGCGKVEALETFSPFRGLKKKLMERTGFRTLSHELEFYGICSSCP